jgi:threonine synthase
VIDVVCSRCEISLPPGSLGRCPNCGGILEPVYSAEAINQLASIRPGPGIDRYRPLLPCKQAVPYLGEGDTPLVRSRRLGPALGLNRLYFKCEGINPSGSFKDRAGAMAAALALDAGSKGVVTASSGNAAAAISAYSAAVDLNCLILLEPGNPSAKLRQALATGAHILPVEGIFSHGPEAIKDLLLAVAAWLNYYPAFVWAPVNPYLLEGIKTISYEIAARLPGPPEVVICPVGGGDMLTAQWRGYLELEQAGIIDRLPRMVAVQSVLAPPLLNAFRSGAERVETLPTATSKISGINVPFSGDHALAAVRDSGGTVAGVEDEAVFELQARLGREEGLWVEPVSAAPLAALNNLLARGEIRPHERVVCILSGAGFKDGQLAAEQVLAVGEQAPLAFDVAEIVRQVISLIPGQANSVG